MNRREVLISLAAVATTAPGQTAVPVAPTVLSAAELAWVVALVDVIIPRTDTPGASDAGVPAFIDRRLVSNAPLATRFRDGMKSLDAEANRKFGAAFPAITPAQQVELLTPMEQDPFFQLVKEMTIDGYYSSKAGLTQELGWHGNTFLTEFKGCTHPEHQS